MTRQRKAPIPLPQSTRSLRPRVPKPAVTRPPPQPKNPRAPRKTKVLKNGHNGWWSIKKILGERLNNGKVEYLVDWDEDPVDPKTGLPYLPTWQQEVKPGALREWEATKINRSKVNSDEKLPSLSSTECEDEKKSESEIDHRVSSPTNEADDNIEDNDDEDDQPPRPATWRQIERVITSGRTHSRSNSLDEATEKRPNKRTRTEPLRTPSVERTPSIASVASPSTDQGSPASLRSQDFARLERQQFIIEISKEPAIDRSEYLSVRGSQLVSELEEEDSRIALTSQISQGTIPDSQDLSGDLWSQPEIDPGSAPEPVDSSQDQRDSCHNLAESLVIPDSQDLSLNCLTSVSQGPDSLLLDQVTPDQSQRDIVPDSVAPEVDIPSHQPDQLEQLHPKTSDKQDSSAPKSHPIDGSACEAVSSSDCQPSVPTTSSAEPLFLTQPQASQDFPLPQSLSSSELPELSRDIDGALSNHEPRKQAIEQKDEPGIETSIKTSHLQDATPCASPAVPISDPSESQAAQIVQRDFDYSPDKITDSHDSNVIGPTSKAASEIVQQVTFPEPLSLSQHQETEPNSFRSSILDPHDPQGAPLSPRIVEAIRAEKEVFERLSEVRRSPFRSPARRLEKKSNMAGKPPRRSAVDELQELLDFTPIEFNLDPPVAKPEALPENTSQRRPAVLFTPGNVTVAPEVTIQSPKLDVLSQPLFQAASPWSAGVTGIAQDLPLQSISPASIMKNPERAALDEIQPVDLTFDQSATSTLMPESAHGQQTTVSPAEISNSIETGDASYSLLAMSSNLATSSRIDDSSAHSITMGQIVDDNEYDESSPPASHDTTPLEHVVTLPFQTSRREPYDNILCEYQVESTAFGLIFSSEILTEPDDALVHKIDELFGRLFNICDYPQDLIGTKLEELPTAEQAKYSCDANPKFNFMFELLQGITKETEILVVARTPELLRLLFNLTESLELDCISQSIGKLESNYKDMSDVRVNLVLSSEDIDPFKYDVVVGFDYQFSSSSMARQLLSASGGSRPPLVLQLVTTYSIEHIDLHIPQDLSINEKKNALLSGVVKARKLVRNLECHPTIEPSEVVEVFANYLNGIEESLSWEPQPMPDSVLDIFVNSQSRSQMPLEGRMTQGNGLKRKLDDDDDDDSEDGDAKRVRTLSFKEPTTESNDPPLTYAVRELLKAGEPKDAAHSRREAQVSVPLATLEVLTEKFAELQRRSEANDLETDNRASLINILESQVKEFQRTSHRTSEALRVSLLDRSGFETEKQKAEAVAKIAAESAQKEVEKTQKRVTELETTLAHLTDAPEGSEENAAASTARLLKEAQDKVQVLEKRLQNAHKDNDYIRNLYQEVNGRAGALGSENKELREQNKDLGDKASQNLREIHNTQRDNTIKAHLQTITDLRAQMREKEIELDRARDELRLLKNGRPQTRQASVPRSPRMGISPRPGRVSASRGTSPAPASGYEGNGSGGIAGMQFMGQQSGNGRWHHLRD